MEGMEDVHLRENQQIMPYAHDANAPFPRSEPPTEEHPYGPYPTMFSLPLPSWAVGERGHPPQESWVASSSWGTPVSPPRHRPRSRAAHRPPPAVDPHRNINPDHHPEWFLPGDPRLLWVNDFPYLLGRDIGSGASAVIREIELLCPENREVVCDEETGFPMRNPANGSVISRRRVTISLENATGEPPLENQMAVTPVLENATPPPVPLRLPLGPSASVLLDTRSPRTPPPRGEGRYFDGFGDMFREAQVHGERGEERVAEDVVRRRFTLEDSAADGGACVDAIGSRNRVIEAWCLYSSCQS